VYRLDRAFYGQGPTRLCGCFDRSVGLAESCAAQTLVNQEAGPGQKHAESTATRYSIRYQCKLVAAYAQIVLAKKSTSSSRTTQTTLRLPSPLDFAKNTIDECLGRSLILRAVINQRKYLFVDALFRASQARRCTCFFDLPHTVGKNRS
jgi:hypothetical protein